MNAFAPRDSQPIAGDHTESTALWASLDKSSDTPPAALTALVAQKNALLAQSRKRTAESAALGTPVSAKKARTPAVRRRLFEKWNRSLVSEAKKMKVTSHGWADQIDEQDVVVKESTAMSVDDFLELFGWCGKDISKSPKAVVQARSFEGREEIQKLFGEVEVAENVAVKVTRSRSFAKTIVVGTCTMCPVRLVVKHSRTKMSVELKFSIVSPDGGYDDDF